MRSQTVFDKLVAELSTSEKQEMLEKVESRLNIPDQPLHEFEEGEAYVDIEEEYHSFSFLEKIIVFFQALFQGADKLAITELHLIRKVQKRVESALPGYFNFTQNTASGRFGKDLVALQKALAVFRTPLVAALTSEQVKKEFYALLGNTYLKYLEEEIEQDTDPWKIWRKSPSLNTHEIKQIIDDKMVEIFTHIEHEDRKMILMNVRSLNILHKMALFPMERIVNFFPPIGDNEYGSAHLYELKDVIKDIADHLYSFSIPPKTNTLRALFLFYLQDNIADKNFKLEEELYGRMNMAKESLAIIREFDSRYPLLDVVKSITGDINCQLSLTGSGDDWFKIYKEFWKSRVNEKFKLFSSEKERQDRLNDLAVLWNVRSINALPRYKRESYEESPPLSFPFTFSAMKKFFDHIFPRKTYYVLNTVLLDGKFYKKDNRKMFDDSFNEMIKFPDKIKALLVRLDEDGEINVKIKRSREALSSPSLRAKRVAEIFAQYERDLQPLIDYFLKILQRICHLLEGIVTGSGGVYDTLSNLSDIGGVNNRQFQKDLNEVLIILQRTHDLMSHLFNLENRLSSSV